MSRRTFDPDADDLPLPPHGKPPLVELRLPCQWCSTSTLRTTLAQYGGRCFACFSAYCSEVQPKPAALSDKRVDGPKGWAWALKTRQEAGERLSLAQADMWHTALGPDLARQRQRLDTEAEADTAHATEVTP